MLRPHVVRVRQAEVLVEAVPRRQELRVVAEVPLAEDGGRVALRLEHFGDRHLVVVDADLGVRPERPLDADAIRVAAGQERRARRGADRLGRVKAVRRTPSAAMRSRLGVLGRAASVRVLNGPISVYPRSSA